VTVSGASCCQFMITGVIPSRRAEAAGRPTSPLALSSRRAARRVSWATIQRTVGIRSAGARAARLATAARGGRAGRWVRLSSRHEAGPTGASARAPKIARRTQAFVAKTRWRSASRMPMLRGKPSASAGCMVADPDDAGPPPAPPGVVRRRVDPQALDLTAEVDVLEPGADQGLAGKGRHPISLPCGSVSPGRSAVRPCHHSFLEDGSAGHSGTRQASPSSGQPGPPPGRAFGAADASVACR
jgi:hypothetical protein